MVCKGIRRATAIPRDALLVEVNPIFWHARKILEELHVILASDDVHKKVISRRTLDWFQNLRKL